MTKNPVGRPEKGKKTVSRADIVTAALDILRTDGERALTMRGLAKVLSVTPMALYHHTGNREALILALAESVYGTVLGTMPKDGSPLERLEVLLMTYCGRVAEYPELTLCIFREPNTFAGQVKRITKALQGELIASGLSPEAIGVWLNILVDYTHGHALSQTQPIQAATENKGNVTIDSYEAGIRLLLKLLKAQIESEAKNDL